jgi:hypothetical protein
VHDQGRKEWNVKRKGVKKIIYSFLIELPAYIVKVEEKKIDQQDNTLLA